MVSARLAQPDAAGVGTTPGFVGVSQVVHRAADAVQRAFPGPIWVKGEVSGYKLHTSGHHYFDLVERTAGGQAVLPCAIWKSIWPQVKKGLAAADIDLTSGMEMLFQGEVSVYGGTGKLSFKITGVYAEFTIGQLEVQRRAVLARLTKEDLLGLNRRMEMPPVPLRLGVVSSRTAAGLQDFIKALSASGYPFKVELIQATVQGTGAEVSIRRALESLAEGTGELGLDAVCIVRGGGSASDLAWWNSYSICAAIARMPVPVVTGIGHEKDRVVADEVAHHAAATPTAAAEYLIGLVRAADTAVREAKDVLASASARLMRDASHAIEVATQAVARHTASRISGETLGLISLGERLAADARRCLVLHRERLDADRHALKREPVRLLRSERSELGDLETALATLAGHKLRLARVESNGLARDVFRMAVAEIDRLATEHDEVTADLTSAAEHLIGGCRAKLGHLADLIQAYDPVRVLQRGFSITLNADGKAVRTVRDVAVGEAIITRLADGEVISTVTRADTGAQANAN